MSVEEQFYLIIPFLFAFMGRKGLLTALLLAAPLAVLALFAFKLRDAAWFAFNFLTIGFGVAAAIHEARVRRWAANTPAWLTLLALAAVPVIWMAPWSTWAIALRTLAITPLVVFVLMTSTFRASPLQAALSWKPLRALGVVSYSFYLWQQLATFDYPGATVWFYLVSVGLCAALAFASYRWFEAPLIAIGARLSRRLTAASSRTSLADETVHTTPAAG